MTGGTHLWFFRGFNIGKKSAGAIRKEMDMKNEIVFVLFDLVLYNRLLIFC